MMKKINKLLALLLIAALMLSTTGCMNRLLTQEEIDAIEPGTVTDGTYENTLFALGFSCPEGWDMATQDDVDAINEWDKEEDRHQLAVDSMGKPGYFYEMMAARSDGLVSANVSIENASVLWQPDITEEAYVDVSIETAQELFDAAGMENTQITKGTWPVDGAEHNGYYASCTTPDGDTMYYKSVYLKVGIYVAVITVSSLHEDLTDDALALFYQV